MLHTIRLLLVLAAWSILATPRTAIADTVLVNVKTDRVAISPGGRVQIEVRLENTGQVSISGRLVLDVFCDAQTKFPLSNDSLKLDAGQKLKRTLAWKAPDDELWGCHVAARFEQDGETIASDRQVFVVSNNLVKSAANLAGISPGYFKTGRSDPIGYAYEKFHRHAVPIVHVFCWTPSNWGTIYPQTDSWICGQMRYRVSFDDVDLMVRHAKERGMFTVTYGRVTLDGLAGYRWAQANPDKVWYRQRDGQITPLTEGELKSWEQAESDPKTSAAKLRGLKRWSMVPKLNDDAVLDDGIDQYLRAIERFDFDCIRWDWHPGYFYHPHTNWLLQIGSGGAVHSKYYDHSGRLDLADDPDAENLRIIKRWKHRMLTARPQLRLGYNLQIMNSVHPENDEINPPPTRAYSEMIRDALIIDEKHFVNLGKGRTAGMHRDWKRTLSFWNEGNKRVRRYGGYHYTGGHPNLGAEPFIQHAYSLSYACGARGTSVVAPNVDQKPWYTSLLTFSQRYAMYFFHPSMHPLTADDKDNAVGGRVSVESSRPVVWKPFAGTVTDRGKFTMVAHLWNQPVRNEMNVNDCEAPPLVENSVVRFSQPADLPHGKAQAYALSYEWPGWIRPVEIDTSGRHVTVDVPPFRYWAVVLLQYPLGDG